MTRVTKTMIGAVMLSGLLLSFGAMHLSTAEARSEAAIGGNPAFGDQGECWDENFGGVENTCPGVRDWVLPMTLDDNNFKNIDVRARGVSGTAQRVWCTAWTVTGGGNHRQGSTAVTSRHDGVTEHLRIGVRPHGFGGTYAICHAETGSLIRSFHY